MDHASCQADRARAAAPASDTISAVCTAHIRTLLKPQTRSLRVVNGRARASALVRGVCPALRLLGGLSAFREVKLRPSTAACGIPRPRSLTLTVRNGRAQKHRRATCDDH
eukprot:540325-Prymnesium_polylepis.2